METLDMRWIIDTAVAVSVLLARNGEVLIIVVVVTPIAAAILMRMPSNPKPFPLPIRLAVPVVIIAVVLNLIWGERLANALIAADGAVGEAEVSAAWTTNETYNYHDVIGYAVSIKTTDGRSVLAGMKSDTFNIYPSGGGLHADRGVQFRVRYLRTYPTLFVILENSLS